MSKVVSVNVTQEHIKQGEANSGNRCPLALAIQAAGYPNARVGVSSVWLDGVSGDIFAALPKEAQRFNHAFDNGIPVAPLSFNLDVKEVVCG